MKYQMHIDEKVEGWMRTTVLIEADSLEEAIQHCKEDDVYEYLDSEFMYETAERMDAKQNDGEPTLEILDEHYNVVLSE